MAGKEGVEEFFPPSWRRRFSIIARHQRDLQTDISFLRHSFFQDDFVFHPPTRVRLVSIAFIGWLAICDLQGRSWSGVGLLRAWDEIENEKCQKRKLDESKHGRNLSLVVSLTRFGAHCTQCAIIDKVSRGQMASSNEAFINSFTPKSKFSLLMNTFRLKLYIVLGSIKMQWFALQNQILWKICQINKVGN